MPLIESLETPATKALEDTKTSFQVFQHIHKITTLQQAAEERGQNPDQIIRSILFRQSSGQFVLVLMAGDRQISWKALRAYLGERRISLASPQDVIDYTGYEIGAVTPFGLLHPTRIIADPSVFTYPQISLGSGKKGFAIILISNLLPRLIENIEITALT
ncbi:MAG TPA: YbaK/EbsC family protein [Longilinea sp.]|nr:YbaK/EbsC family protein [Longilinea sp.]